MPVRSTSVSNSSDLRVADHRAPAAAPSDPAVAPDLHDHRVLLQRLAVRMCRNTEDARDLVQDTFERALRYSHGAGPVTNARSLLVTILSRLYIDRYRVQRTRAAIVPIDEVQLSAPEPAPAPSWTSITHEQLRDALACLDPKFREVCELHAVAHLPYQDIAARLGISKATVGTRLLRARRKLRALLAPETSSSEPPAAPRHDARRRAEDHGRSTDSSQPGREDRRRLPSSPGHENQPQTSLPLRSMRRRAGARV